MPPVLTVVLAMLTRSEAAALRTLSPYFDAIDRNRDGLISADEVRAWRSVRFKHRRAAAPSGLAPLLARADADGDGTLSRAEAQASLPRLAARFDQIDADGDRRLSREEIEAWLARRRALRSIVK
jgi:Ca2+-binding EF-hand superfamily protein